MTASASAQPLVCVITPCYNDGQWLENCQQTVQAQTYPHIEWIVVDDGSEDQQTLTALTRLETEGITLLRNSHGGPSAARNVGIAHASGQYILPLDCDDAIDPTYIEKAVAAMQEDVSRRVVYCRADFAGEQSGEWALPDFEMGRFLADNIIFVTALFHRADWERAGGFSPDLPDGLEDYDFWLRLAEQGAQFYRIPEVLFHYQIHNSSRTQSMRADREKLQRSYHEVFSRHKALYLENAESCISAMRGIIIDQRLAIDQLHASETCLTQELIKARTHPLTLKLQRYPHLYALYRRLRGR